MKFLSVEPLLEHLGPMNLQGINWVIVGGESGHGARALDPNWVLDIRDQCQEANVAFFFKLMRRRVQNLLPRQLRPGMQQRKHILQLVAEAEGAARLIPRRASPDAATERLIGLPAIEKEIHR